MVSQRDKILASLRRRPLTAIDAFKLCQCMNLAGRIGELRQDGYTIESEMVKLNGKRFAQYSLTKEPK